MDLLKATPFKSYLNNAVKSMLQDETLVLSTKQLLTNNFIKQCKIASEDYQLLIGAQIDKGLRKIKTYGCIAFSSKQMGLSPRILPINYGNSINSVKRLVGDQVYEWISQYAVKQDYILADLDKSPFFEEIYAQAQKIATQMMNSLFIHDFQSVSKMVQEQYMGEFLTGPTGHSYKVTETTFKTAYPNYLQSFEGRKVGKCRFALVL
jgi:hypothetical protein